jgi:26S proteasome regulatory subunit T2
VWNLETNTVTYLISHGYSVLHKDLLTIQMLIVMDGMDYLYFMCQVDELRGSPMSVGNLEEIIDDNHAIVSTR